MSNGFYINNNHLQRAVKSISSSLRASSPLVYFRSEKPGNPWRYGWPHCWGQHQAGSPERFGGTLGLALHRNPPPPVYIEFITVQVKVRK